MVTTFFVFTKSVIIIYRLYYTPLLSICQHGCESRVCAGEMHVQYQSLGCRNPFVSTHSVFLGERLQVGTTKAALLSLKPPPLALSLPSERVSCEV